ncbi:MULTISPECIES: DUF3180 domain-containing protein [Nocardiaceae]|uniref:DUF3180 domain-containing protein n=1 Tax=Nocardiaceae TaxID=85025 RepID=UPI00050CFAC6|nr:MULTISPECIES: DUF3180 domain-containing protein [Rhodococcus]OZC47491.1 DUF3180 domain-containing protein [Rhodococcus sp. WWJCD1]OZE80634.1 DUF3180 domain-containing protein [Rhodococcus sp. 15-649-2-2]QII04783.1 DUF3180 domain-containing protein [Rhodococcus fascians A25f]
MTNPTKVGDVLGIFLVASVGTWLLVRVFYGSLPPIPVYAGASLYLVAVVEVVTAVIVRNRIAEHRVGTGLHDLNPLTVYRALVLAKASMLVGTAVVGVCVGFLVYVMPRATTVRAASSDRVGAMVALVAGVAVVGAAVWLEQCCRTPKDRDDERSR